jgi:hypothetical protein
MGNVLNNNQENDEMRIGAARALGDFDNPNAIEILLPVVASYGHAPLGFWSAASIVKLTGGETGDPSVVAAVKNYRRIENELPITDVVAQIEALDMIAAHGNWRAQLALRGISLTAAAIAVFAAGLVCFGIVRLAKRRKREKSAPL